MKKKLKNKTIDNLKKEKEMIDGEQSRRIDPFDKLRINTEQSRSIEEIIVWQAPEYNYRPKDVSWYWLSLIISIIIIAIALWQKNFLFAIFIVIAELVIIYFANQFPKIWEFKIDTSGLKIGGNKFYSFGEIQYFDIHAGEGEKEFKELILKFNSRLSPYLKILIYPEDEEKIRTHLLNFIEQEEISLSFSDSLEKFIHF